VNGYSIYFASNGAGHLLLLLLYLIRVIRQSPR
jgi:hypothetical protein